MKPDTVPALVITLRQAEHLLKFFGGHDAEIAVSREAAGQPPGLYAWCVDCPEEGSVYLGPTEVDDELADKGRPIAAATAPAGGLHQAWAEGYAAASKDSRALDAAHSEAVQNDAMQYKAPPATANPYPATAPAGGVQQLLPDWDFSYDASTDEVLVKAADCNPGVKWVPAGGSLDRRLLHALGKALAAALTTAAGAAEPAEEVQRIVHLRTERDRRVYVAGPMTGYPEFNFPLFNETAKRLRAEGWHVENPAEHGHVEGAGWADYLRWDISRIATCGAIYLLPGWEKSKGACLEVHIGTVLGTRFYTAPGAVFPTDLPAARAAEPDHVHFAWRGGLKACGVSAADRDAISEVVQSMLAASPPTGTSKEGGEKP